MTSCAWSWRRCCAAWAFAAWSSACATTRPTCCRAASAWARARPPRYGRCGCRWGTQSDLFAAVCLRGGDLLVADTTSPRELQRMPAWYRQHFDAGAFVLLPLMRNDKPFALLYADHAQPGGIVLDDRGFALLRTLRNQAVMAFRQAG
ncbi:GAF domain-containing protein [Xylophilus ampelinus]|uniref:GAF domain-containing protein n=1 Tax=Xylophilus ampelinus TaxID=54067 RepID=UPI0035BBA044